MKKVTVIIAIWSLFFAVNAMAMSHGEHDGGGAGGHDEQAMEHKSAEMDHSSTGMNHGSESMDGTFKHAVMADDVHAEFQVMELAAMNMKDPEGNTHHVMATFKRNNEQLGKVVGKVKLISPSGKEQLASLKDYGSGVFAANFKIDEPGKWGVICLFKDDGGKHTVKFWYPHMAM